MELTPGYKKTDVGVVPEGWSLTPLGSLFAFSNGFNADRSAYGRGMPFINVLEAISYSHIHGPEIPGRVEMPESLQPVYSVRSGDMVFNRTSETDTELGLAAVYLGEQPVTFGGFVIRGRPTGDMLDPVYAGYALRAPTVRAQIVPMGQGAVRANIGQQSLRTVIVTVPPKSEQRAIAAALSDLDALVTSLQQLLVKKRHIKQSATQELLTGKKRLPGFVGEWLVERLGELGVFVKGRGVTRSDSSSGDIPCVRYGEIYTTHDDYIREYQTRISPKVAAGATRLMTGDVLFAGSGETKEEIGKCAAFVDDIEAYAGGDIIILRPVGVDSRFLGYYLNTEPIRVQKAGLGQGDAVVHISGAALGSIEVLIPPTAEEQTAIATVLSEMDAEIDALEAQLEKTRAIKQGMMHELLTGRIRLV